MVELVDTLDLGSSAARRGGSSPLKSTTPKKKGNKMFGSLFGLVGDVAKVVLTPVAVVADVARVVTKPTADVVTDVAKEIGESVRAVID